MFLREGEIYFNKLYSQKDLGLRIENYPSIPLSYENYTEEKDIYMRKSPLIFNDGTFNNKEVTFTFTKNNKEDILNFDEIYDWLYNVKDNRFMYQLDDRCLICKKVVVGDFKQQFKTFGEFDVKFILGPFWEDIHPKKIDIGENDYVFRYFGTAVGEPFLKVYAKGNISLILNGEVLKIDNVENFVTIDCEHMKIKDSFGEDKEFDTQGGFFQFTRANQKLSYTGKVIKIELTYKNKWR